MISAYLFPENTDYQTLTQIMWQISSISLAQIMLENRDSLVYRQGKFLSIY
jgi:hypothetical protein